ncbi:hypothetical protein PMAYCL1PPCAC_21064, partial [Pristionchus mayeri]
RMDNDVIQLSDDESSFIAPPLASNYSRTEQSKVPSNSSSLIGIPPPRTIMMRSKSPEVLFVSGSPLRANNTEATAAKQTRVNFSINTPSNADLDVIFDDPMFGGRGVRLKTCPVNESSDDAETKKRKSKRVIEEEKKRKQEERDQKRQLRDEKRAIDAKEKKLRAIEREISASKKSKAEEFVFCRVGQGALDMISGFEAALRVLMADRKIDTQLEIKLELETRIEWWRKSIEAMELDTNKGVERIESMIQEPLEVIFVDTVALASIIKAGALEQHVIKLRSSLGVSNALLILVVIGKLNVKDSERDAQAVVLHERLKTQLREVHSPNEAALLVCQLHRATARLHTKRSEKIIADVTKGQRERIGLVSDWWGKMLAMAPRLSGVYARALIAAFPNPFLIMDRIENEGQEAMEAVIAEVRTDIGIRIGASRARKVIELLITDDGMELFT